MHYEPIKHRIDRFISASPFLKKLFFRILDLYLLRTWHIHHELKEIFKIRKDRINILDAGCGFGQYSWYISRKNKHAEITAVDISASHVEKAIDFFRKTGKKNVHCHVADLTDYHEDEKFDLIISVDVMEHISDDRQVFSNFFRSLKPGGLLLISTPSDKGGSDVHEAHDTSFIEEHVRDGYSISDITEKLKSAGFAEVSCRYTYGNPGQLSWRLLMKIPVTMINKSKLSFIVLPFYLTIVILPCLFLNFLDLKIDHHTGTGLLVKARK